jgi:hypothetical protein
MKKSLVILIIFFLQVGYLSAQFTKGKVTGSIYSKLDEQPMEFVNVILIDSLDHPVANTLSDKRGSFSLTNVRSGKYQVKFTFIGYADFIAYVDITSASPMVSLDTVYLDAASQNLEEVVIVGKRSVIERQIDKLVMNVANTIVAQNSTALDILRKAPGIVIDKDGNITLNGQAVQVWIDNRPTQLSGMELILLLGGTEGSTIDKIEIIDQPSSKYDAAGSGGIINIKTKKNFIKGLNGSVRAGYTQYLEDDFYYNGNGALNLNYRNDLISSFINVTARGYKNMAEVSEEMREGSAFQREMDMKSEDKGNSQNVRGGIDFFIDKKNVIGVIGNFIFRNTKEDGKSTTITKATPDVEGASLSVSKNDNRFIAGTGNVNYTHYFSGEGDHDLTVNLDYMAYENKPEQRVFVNAFTPVAQKDSAYTDDSKQRIAIASGKIDYIRPVGDGMKLELGAKASWSKTDNELLHRDSTVTGWVNNLKLSEDFVYKENVDALYVTYGWQINRMWSVKGGLRWEYTYAKGEWEARTESTKNYNDIFPTVFLGYIPGEKHNLNLSYTRRIQRPNYWQINPFRRFLSEYSYIEGNPDLKPEYSHRITMSYTGFSYFNAGVMGSFSDDQIIQIPTKDGNLYGFTQGNFGKLFYISMWAGLSEFKVTTWWDLTVNVTGAYSYSEDHDYTRESFSGNMYTSNTFWMGKTWKAEVSFWGRTPMSYGYFDIKAQGSMNVGIQKSLWKSKAFLSLFVDDVFASMKNNTTSDVNGIYRVMDNAWTSRSVRMSFSYYFGNTQRARQRRVGQQEEASRLNSETRQQ